MLVHTAVLVTLACAIAAAAQAVGVDLTDDAGAIRFGAANDVNLYRTAGPALQTDNSLNVGGTLTASSIASTGALTIGATSTAANGGAHRFRMLQAAVRCETTGAPAIPTGSAELTPTSCPVNTDGMWPGSGNKYYVPVTGLYSMTGFAYWQAGGGGTLRYIAILLNGSTYLAINSLLPNGSGDYLAMNVATMARLTTGDYVQFRVFQNAGAAVSLATANSPAAFTMHYVGE